MKKKYIFIFSILIFLICVNTINAGFFDGFFSEDSKDSEPKFSDIGVAGNTNSNWYYLKNLNVSITDNGTILKNNGNENAFYAANKPSTPMDDTNDLFDWNSPYTVEFDVVSDKGASIQIFDKNNSTSRTFKQLGITSNSHVKIVNNGTAVGYYINGVNNPVFTYNDHSFDKSAIRFVIPPQSSLIYKNFTIYEN